MASRSQLRAKIRQKYLTQIRDFFESQGEEVLLTKSNQLAIPTCDDENNEETLTITFAVPLGSKADNEPFDPYTAAEVYAQNTENKRVEAEKRAKAKAEKIKRDKEYREKQKANKEKRKGA